MAIKYTAIVLEPGDKVIACSDVESEYNKSEVMEGDVLTVETVEKLNEFPSYGTILLRFVGIKERFDAEDFVLHVSTKPKDVGTAYRAD